MFPRESGDAVELAELIVARPRVIGDANRIRILDLLRDGQLTVGRLTERLVLFQ